MVFWSREVKVDEEAAFQFTMIAPTAITLSSIPFSRITFNFSESVPPIVVDHEPSDTDEEVKVVKLGHVSSPSSSRTAVKANLLWLPGSTTVFTGTVSSSEPSELKVGYYCGVISEDILIWKFSDQVCNSHH